MSDILKLVKAVNEKCQSKDGSIDHRYWAFRSVELLPELIAEIERLQGLIDKPPEEADWVADYHLLQSALDGPIIDAARKWHAAYRKAQNSNLMRAKEVERLRSARKSGLYGKYIIQKADGSPVDPEADYFILRLDADPVARIAALEYAIQTDDQKLGEMLEKRVMDHVFSKDDQCRKRVEGWPLGQIKRLRKEIAAKDARIADQEAYIERLEAAFLEEYQRGCVMLSPNAAKEALERIKGGRKDESI